ncbi:MAG TPA: type II toxin-antitoxin system VapC family toxin [Vicinamibacterales bacterium]|nr:type II toxin-antitoxin system VapC family toxin [Vicinamibacterales bacterium]
MGRSLILETSFLIDLEREHNRSSPGPAVGFLETNDTARLYLPFIVAGELASGTSLADRPRWEAFLAPFFVLASSPDVCWEYGRIYRYLQENGRLIGGNDLWIAATALAYGMPVVTRNAEHYRRVPGLEVEGY